MENRVKIEKVFRYNGKFYYVYKNNDNSKSVVVYERGQENKEIDYLSPEVQDAAEFGEVITENSIRFNRKYYNLKNIIIKNCRNIKDGDIDIAEGLLNIKYGVNGTGKSSIVKAINFLKKKNDGNIDLSKEQAALRPFDAPLDTETEVHCDFKNIKIFDPQYINDHLFDNMELYKNSFELVIENDETRKIKDEITSIYRSEGYNVIVEKICQIQSELDKAIKRNSVRYKGKNAIPTRGYLAVIKQGNSLTEYSENNSVSNGYKELVAKDEWYEWMKKGNNFVEDDCCPYCLEKLKEDTKKELQEIKEYFDTKNIDKYLQTVKSFKDKVFCRSSDEDINTYNEIFNRAELTDGDCEFLRDKTEALISELNKANVVKNIYSNLKFDAENTEEIKDMISGCRINTDNFRNEEEKKEIEKYNELVDKLEIASQKSFALYNELTQKIGNRIKQNEEFINTFLKNAGMKYVMSYNEEDKKIILVPDYKNTNVNEVLVNESLSFGEKNALSLMLFALECKSENPDLIVLDDPISSFDINKRFAIIYQLFNYNIKDKDSSGNHNPANDGLFIGKTVLVLTHEFSIVNDVFKAKNIECPNYVTHIHNRKNILREDSIYNDDVAKINIRFMKAASDRNKSKIVRALNIRKLIEVGIYKENKLMYDLISNFEHIENAELIHKTYENGEEQYKPFLEGEKQKAQEEIKNLQMDDYNLKDFDFDNWRKELTIENVYSDFYKTNNAAEKVIICRYLSQLLWQTYKDKTLQLANVAWKFVNEAYHVENLDVSSLIDDESGVPEFALELVEAFVKGAHDRYPK